MKALVLGAGMFLASVHAGLAESFTWHFQSDYPYAVHFRLFSMDRRNHVWPNGSEVWVLDDYAVHSYPISCNSGEKICYGAWPAGGDGSHYWGAGRYGNDACDNCCYDCDGGESRIMHLLDN